MKYGGDDDFSVRFSNLMKYVAKAEGAKHWKEFCDSHTERSSRLIVVTPDDRKPLLFSAEVVHTNDIERELEKRSDGFSEEGLSYWRCLVCCRTVSRNRDWHIKDMFLGWGIFARLPVCDRKCCLNTMQAMGRGIPPKGICTFCGKSGAVKKCSGCMSARYCTRECQVKNWELHKPICAKLAAEKN